MIGSGGRFERVLNQVYAQMTPEMRLKLQSAPRKYSTTLSFTPPRHLDRSSVREYLNNVRTLVKGIADDSNRTLAKFTSARNGSDDLPSDDDLKYAFSFAVERAEIDINHLVMPKGGSMAMVELLAMGVQISSVIDLYNEWAFGTMHVAELGAIFQGITDAARLYQTSLTKALPAKIVPSERITCA